MCLSALRQKVRSVCMYRGNVFSAVRRDSTYIHTLRPIIIPLRLVLALSRAGTAAAAAALLPLFLGMAVRPARWVAERGCCRHGRVCPEPSALTVGPGSRDYAHHHSSARGYCHVSFIVDGGTIRCDATSMLRGSWHRNRAAHRARRALGHLCSWTVQCMHRGLLQAATVCTQEGCRDCG